MAIVTSYKTAHGIDLPKAYINITTLQTFKHVVNIEHQAEAPSTPPFNQHTVRVYLNVYASPQAYADGLPNVESIERVYPMDTASPAHEQVYAALADELDGHAA